MTGRAVGIIGLGLHLPELRTNDWWPEAQVAAWRAHESNKLDRPPGEETFSEGALEILAAMSRYRDDPFRGAISRHVLPSGVPSSVMELAAARDALERAGIGPEQLGLVLVWSAVPDHLLVPQGCSLHRALGAPPECMTVDVGAAQNSFHHQVALASAWIASGRVDHALLIQSCAWSRWFDPGSPVSAWVGDGATAVVLGPVRHGYGLIADHHETDGSYVEGMAFGSPDRRWYDGEAVRAYFINQDMTRRVLTETVARGAQVAQRALSKAALDADEIDFYAVHQAFAWMRETTQRQIGLSRARSVDTYTTCASVSGVNVPLVLAQADRQGLLRDGDEVLTMSGGAGVTISSAIFRWGGVSP